MSYPAIEPHATRRLPVALPHVLYVEECGNPLGLPVVVLHGGPGSGCRPHHRTLFDPGFYRILLFDQRGSGRSEPRGWVRRNRTPDLIDDLERIRRALGVDRWLLFGGSWGATLALLYAQAHPETVLGLVLRGVFLARPRDLDWFFGADGAARVFPEAWQSFSGMIPDAERGDLVAAYDRRVRDPNGGEGFVEAWSAWEDRVATWSLGPATRSRATGGEDLERQRAKVRIATHFARHAYFIAPNQILDRAALLPDVPISIVQGRRDLVCPMEGAWALQHAVPGSRLIVVPAAGHLDSEPEMVDALVGETDRLRDLLGRRSGSG
jgi:proline iminopeptidase